MKENFDIEKELKFNSNIAEISSISLEEKHEINDGCLKGNFIVSGDYRIHEISLNKEKFNYKIPFKHEIKSDIDESTLDVDITNFIYDIDTDSLFVTISYNLIGDRKDILLFDDDENLDEFLKSREVELIMDDVQDEIDEVLEKCNEKGIDIPALKNEIREEISKVVEEKENVSEEVNLENSECLNVLENDQNNIEEIKEESIRNNIEESKEKLLDSVNVNDDNYITYKIHIVKNEDTIESILGKYNMSFDEFKEYNEVNALQLGDKLIIPIINEE